MRRENKKRNKIIIGLISLLLLMTVGYAAFQTNLNIKGTSKISSNWDIRITNVTSGNKTGNAENAKTPTWTNLTASMEANLYEKGDAMEYEVTVENKGTFDAKLEEIITNIKSNNEAIKISFSGYTKGEKLYKNTSKVVNVKIEYNKDFTGTPPTNSSEVEITLDYGQAEGGTITPTNDYLVTYDYKTNGGTSSTSQNEYLSEGAKIDLSYTATKAGWTFAGWNTNKDATTGLTSLEMKNADVTLYAIYKKEGKILTASFNNNGGVGTIENITCKIPTVYNNTEQPKTCNITLPNNTFTKEEMDFIGWNTDNKAKEGLNINQSISEDTEYYAIWKDTTKPIIDDVSTSSTTNSITVVVKAHDDQSGISKYEYSINGDTYIETTSNAYTFNDLTENMGYNISVKVINGDEMFTISETQMTVAEQLKQSVITSGDGLYTDIYEMGRYVYRGNNPNNYIKFNNEMWRILSLEADGTVKIIKNDFLEDKLPWDSKNNNNWSKPSSLNDYLNNDYYDSLSNLAKNQVQNHNFNIGTMIYTSNQDFATDLIQDKAKTWKGKVGLISVIDYIKASKDLDCDNLYHGVYYNESNPRPCANQNYLFDSTKYWWTVNGRTESNSGVWAIVSVGSFGSFGGVEDWYTAQDPLSVRPVTYLKSNIRLSGDGTLLTPYLIENGINTQKLYKPTFSESGTNIKTVIISYPEGCGDKYMCSYSKDGNSYQTVTTNAESIIFNNNGSLIAKVSDGENEVTSSYTVLLNYDYNYTGGIQTFTAPLDGFYKIKEHIHPEKYI